MVNKLIYLICILVTIVLSLTLADSELEIIGDDLQDIINIDSPTPPINYSMVNVNNSDYLDGLDSSFFANETWVNGTFIRLDGTSTTTSYIPFALGLTSDGPVVLQTDGSLMAYGGSGFSNYFVGTNGFGWQPSRGILRAGYDAGGEWAEDNLGNYSDAFGYAPTASQFASIAFGDSCSSLAQSAVAMGGSTKATGKYAMSVGYITEAQGRGSFTQGYNQAGDYGHFVAGDGTANSGAGQTAIGYSTSSGYMKAEGNGSIAMGQDVQALTNPNIIVMGRDTTSTEQESFNVGFYGILLKVNKTGVFENNTHVYSDDNSYNFLNKTTNTVSNGGTGAGSFNARGVIIGGTATTSQLRSVATVAGTGQILRNVGLTSDPGWTTTTYPNLCNANYLLLCTSGNVVGTGAGTASYLYYDQTNNLKVHALGSQISLEDTNIGGNNVNLSNNAGIVTLNQNEVQKIRLSKTNLNIGWNSTDNIQMSATNPMTLLGEYTVWMDAQLPAAGLSKGASAPVDTAWNNTIVYLPCFSGTSDDVVYGCIEVPHNWKVGTSISPHVHWSPAVAPSSGDQVVWNLTYMWTNMTGGYALTGGLLNQSLVPTQWKDTYSEFTDIASASTGVGSQFCFALTRLSSNANDNYTGCAGVKTIAFHYQIDKLGTDNELT